MKRVFANLFTGEYISKTGNIVYPSKLSGEWQVDGRKIFMLANSIACIPAQKKSECPEDVQSCSSSLATSFAIIGLIAQPTVAEVDSFGGIGGKIIESVLAWNQRIFKS